MCNLHRFEPGRITRLFIERVLARKTLIAWHDPVRHILAMYNGEFWMCWQHSCMRVFTRAATGAEGKADGNYCYRSFVNVVRERLGSSTLC